MASSHERSGSTRPVASHRSTLSLTKTEVSIHVYDLLPPGRLSSVLWTIGTGLLHSGVVINGKEYAYGGHARPGMTGVYWTRPKTVPPGGTFRCAILHGFTFASQPEIDAILDAISHEFLGTTYNLLTRNCNHFTSALCQRLTGQPGPAWLNRAASIGVALPCVVPREWVEPPEYDTADGALLDDFDGEEARPPRSSARLVAGEPGGQEQDGTELDEWDSEEERRRGGSGKGKKVVRDQGGRPLPASERAPVP